MHVADTELPDLQWVIVLQSPASLGPIQLRVTKSEVRVEEASSRLPTSFTTSCPNSWLIPILEKSDNLSFHSLEFV